MQRKFVYNIFTFFVIILIMFSICACGSESEIDRGRIVTEEKKENETKREEVIEEGSLLGLEKKSDNFSDFPLEDANKDIIMYRKN